MIADKLYDEIKNNLKNPKMYAIILALVIVIFLLFPYLDANLFYYKRIDSRVEILTKVSQIDAENLSDNSVLRKEYDDILFEISQQPENAIVNVFAKENRPYVNVMKFVSGGLLFWILAVACLFMKTLKGRIEKAISFVLLVVVGLLFGFLAKSIPNIINPWVNVIGFPIMLIIIITLGRTKGSINIKKTNDVVGNNVEKEENE